MRIALPMLLAAAVALLGEEPPGPSVASNGHGFGSRDSDEVVQARARALDVAGAFANDGYKLRDGYWSGLVTDKKPLFLEVSLFHGNQYWFTAAAASDNAALSLLAFDEEGIPLDGNIFRDEGVVAFGFEPPASGRYYLRLDLAGGNVAAFCLIYSYK